MLVETAIATPVWAGGRPARKNYQELKPQIERLLAEGYGVPRIARFLELSPAGAKLVLKRLKLRTIYQKPVAE